MVKPITAYAIISPTNGELIPLAFDSPNNPRLLELLSTFGTSNLIEVRINPVLKNGKPVRMTKQRIAAYNRRFKY